MQNYIKLDDKMIVSNGSISVLESSNSSKELIEESNKLEEIENKIREKRYIYKEEHNIKDHRMFFKNLMANFILLGILTLTVVLLISVKNDLYENLLYFSKMCVPALAGVSLLKISSAIDKIKLKKMSLNYEESMKLLNNQKEASLEKINSLEKKYETSNEINIAKYNEENNLENYVMFDQVNTNGENNKVKKLGTR